MQYGRDWFIETLPEVKKLVARSKAEGKVEALQEAIIILVQGRFPALTDLARQRTSLMRYPNQLHAFMRRLSVAPNEESMRKLLQG